MAIRLEELRSWGQPRMRGLDLVNLVLLRGRIETAWFQTGVSGVHSTEEYITASTELMRVRYEVQYELDRRRIEKN